MFIKYREIRLALDEDENNIAENISCLYCCQ